MEQRKATERGEEHGLRELRDRAARFGQEHIFRFWNDLDGAGRNALLDQVAHIDFELVGELCRRHLGSPDAGDGGEDVAPAPIIRLPQTDGDVQREKRARDVGEALLREGKVAAFVVAGGQGTRLGFDGPKGTYPIGPVSGRTLFQIFAEKLVALSRRHGATIPWLVMTSESNDAATRAFFERNTFFGLDPEAVFFFQQEMLPAVDREGRYFLQTPSRVFTSPNGHGGSLKALYDSGAIDTMRDRGVELIFYFQVDNPLVVMCDPVFIGHHVLAGAEMSSKAVRKTGWDEKVGVFGLRGGKLTVIEYSDLPEEDARATEPDGELRYWAGSIAIHVLSVDFVERLNRGGFRLPYHRAEKAVPHLDAGGRPVQPEGKNGVKFESFVFDALERARRTMTMEVRRRDEFSPVKNAAGVDSPEQSRRDLSALYLRWLEDAGATIDIPPDRRCRARVEISPITALDARDAARTVSPRTTIRDGTVL